MMQGREAQEIGQDYCWYSSGLTGSQVVLLGAQRTSLQPVVKGSKAATKRA